MAGPVQLDPRKSGRKGSVSPGDNAWAVVVVVATTIGVLQGPKAVVDLHELMCGSASWQGIAGRFGDCATYAEKSRTTVVINGPGAPKGPVPRATQYNQQYADFRTALMDDDKDFLVQVQSGGFRLRAEHVCDAVSHVISKWADSGRQATRVDLDFVLTFSDGPVGCKRYFKEGSWLQARENVPHDRWVLDSAMDGSLFSCSKMQAERNPYRSNYWAAHAAAIDKLLAWRPPSPEFKAGVKAYLAALSEFSAATPERLIAVCTETVSGLPNDDASVFQRIVRACSSRGYTISILQKARSTAELSKSGGSAGSLEQLTRERVPVECAVRMKEMAPTNLPLAPALTRWSR